jgi:hypothetical protein
VWDVLDGEHNALIALSTEPKPDEIVAGLGRSWQANSSQAAEKCSP